MADYHLTIRPIIGKWRHPDKKLVPCGTDGKLLLTGFQSGNSRGDRPGKVQFSELQKPCDLDLGSGHMTYRCASVIDLYLHTKFHWNRKNFLWTDVRTYVWTYLPTDRHFAL